MSRHATRAFSKNILSQGRRSFIRIRPNLWTPSNSNSNSKSEYIYIYKKSEVFHNNFNVSSKSDRVCIWIRRASRTLNFPIFTHLQPLRTKWESLSTFKCNHNNDNDYDCHHHGHRLWMAIICIVIVIVFLKLGLHLTKKKCKGTTIENGQIQTQRINFILTRANIGKHCQESAGKSKTSLYLMLTVHIISFAKMFTGPVL